MHNKRTKACIIKICIHIFTVCVISHDFYGLKQSVEKQQRLFITNKGYPSCDCQLIAEELKKFTLNSESKCKLGT